METLLLVLKSKWFKYLLIIIVSAAVASYATHTIMQMKIDKLNAELKNEKQKLTTCVETNESNVAKALLLEKANNDLKSSYDKRLNYCWSEFNKFKKIKDLKGGVDAETGVDTLHDTLNSMYSK